MHFEYVSMVILLAFNNADPVLQFYILLNAATYVSVLSLRGSNLSLSHTHTRAKRLCHNVL